MKSAISQAPKKLSAGYVLSRDGFATGAIWAVVLIAVALMVVQPLWQIHDDSYYSMIAGGFGIADAPSADIPFMHPLVGRAAFAIERVVGPYAYSGMLYGLLFLGLWSLFVSFDLLGLSKIQSLLGSLFVIPLLWAPQYTIVSAWLAVSGLLAIRIGLADSKVLVFAGLLQISISMLLRIEMFWLAMAVSTPLIIFSFNKLAWRPALVFLAVLVLLHLAYYMSERALLAPEMRGFLDLHAQRVPFVDYGIASQLLTDEARLPPNVNADAMRLFASWFFAEPGLFPVETQAKLLSEHPLAHRLSYGFSTWFLHIRTIYLNWYFPLLSALLVGLVVRSTRVFLGLSLIAFIFADSLLSLAGRPIPDRVAMGLMAGLLGLSWLNLCRAPDSGVIRLAKSASLVGLVITCLLVARGNFKESMEYDGGFWRSLGIQQGEVVYFMASGLRLQSEYKPLHPKGASAEVPPVLVPLGTFYQHPQIQEQESKRKCGRFMDCLMAGVEVKVFARPDVIELLGRYLSNQRGRQLIILEHKSLGGSQLFQLLTKPKEAAQE